MSSRVSHRVRLALLVLVRGADRRVVWDLSFLSRFALLLPSTRRETRGSRRR